MCKKFRKRSIYKLWEVFNCDACYYNKEDFSFKIGFNKINIYYLFPGCLLDNDIDDKFIFTNKKLMRLLYDYILCSNNDLILWFDELNIIEDLSLDFELCFELSRTIHIICL